MEALAWVESPLQFVAAAEWAATHDGPVSVAFRLTGPQMTTTAAELLSRGARFARCEPYFGIPWALLGRHREWAIGDGFSGQFRLASSVLRPRHLSLLDDGAQTVALVDALLGSDAYSRPGRLESATQRLLGSLARDRMLGLASHGALEVATAFPLGTDRMSRLAHHGVRVTRHRLDWVRASARPAALPGARVLLGSALPVDGRLPGDAYLRWVATEASVAPLVYLPHRRETVRQLADVAALPGVTIYEPGLPVELVLAGAGEPLEIITLPTSARTTLGYLLEGTGSVITSRSLETAGAA